MAQPLRKYPGDICPDPEGTAVVPIKPVPVEPAQVSTSAGAQIGLADADAVAAVRSYLVWVRRDAITSYAGVKQRWASLRDAILGNVQRARNERPLQLLAGMMGIAFALGLALRWWRDNEQ